MRLTNIHALFKHKQFAKFWVSRFSGILGNQMFMVALGWQMYDLTADPWDLGLVGLYEFLPALLLTLPAGHTADKFHRGKIFATCMLLQFCVAALILTGQLSGFLSPNLIFIAAIFLGIARAYQMPAQQALVPLLVPKAQLESAIAFSTSGMQAAVILGPALGGLIYTFGSQFAYTGCCIAFSIAFPLMWSLTYLQQTTRTPATLKTVLAGAHYVWSHKVLLGAITLDLFAVLLGGATALLPIYAKDILLTNPIGLGALRSAPAFGALIMSMLLVYKPISSKVGAKLLLAVGIFGIATIGFGISKNIWFSLFMLAITGAADSVSVVARLTLTQIETPDEIRGRVAAVSSIFIGASNQLGEFESGWTASLFGPIHSVVFGGLGTILVVLASIKIFPELAKKDRLYK